MISASALVSVSISISVSIFFFTNEKCRCLCEAQELRKKNAAKVFTCQLFLITLFINFLLFIIMYFLFTTSPLVVVSFSSLLGVPLQLLQLREYRTWVCRRHWLYVNTCTMTHFPWRPCKVICSFLAEREKFTKWPLSLCYRFGFTSDMMWCMHVGTLWQVA